VAIWFLSFNVNDLSFTKKERQTLLLYKNREAKVDLWWSMVDTQCELQSVLSFVRSLYETWIYTQNSESQRKLCESLSIGAHTLTIELYTMEIMLSTYKSIQRTYILYQTENNNSRVSRRELQNGVCVTFCYIISWLNNKCLEWLAIWN